MITKERGRKPRIFSLEERPAPEDKELALKIADTWGDKIPIGIIYWNN